MSRAWSKLVPVLASLMLLACASSPSKEGQVSAQEVERFNERMNKKPERPLRRAELYRQREELVNRLLSQGDDARGRGELERAQTDYRNVLALDPANLRAQAGLDAVTDQQRHGELLNEAEALVQKGDLDAALARLRAVLAENSSHREARALQRRINEERVQAQVTPTLNSIYRKPVTLEFRDANLKSVFELLSRTTEINFLFDKDVRPDLKATIFVKNTTIEDAIKLLLVTSQLQYKILNENTVLIYPNTPAKAKDYQELVVKSFYLANADAKQAMNLIKAVVKTRDMYIDEKLGLLIMRDTPEAVRSAEKLIAAQDLAEPEVMLEMEVLEVSTNRLTQLGIRYPERISASVLGAARTPGTLALNELRNFNSDMVNVSVTDPAVILNLRKTDADTNLLANPRIRVKNREKAKIHIGERVPVITTTSTANVGVSESVNYLDVGLKLELEPNIYLQDEVAMKVGLEVSNILETVTRPSGTQTYRVGTRNAATVLRLKDGETQILAGLIQDADRKSADKVPLLGDIPLLGRLFSSHDKSKIKTEIVLLMTPHIIRNIDRPAADVIEFASGTEGAIGASPLQLRSGGFTSSAPAEQPPIAPEGTSAPEPPEEAAPAQEQES